MEYYTAIKKECGNSLYSDYVKIAKIYCEVKNVRYRRMFVVYYLCQYISAYVRVCIYITIVFHLSSEE